MNKKFIILKEGYQWLEVGEGANYLTPTEFNTLCKYIKAKLPINMVAFGFNKIKFINYVGVIAIGNLTIEILPKLSLTNDLNKDRYQLVFMLSKCKKLPIDVKKLNNLGIVNLSLIEIIGKLYGEELSKEYKKGIYFEYVSIEENLNKIKGKLELTKHVKENTFNKNRVICRYDEFTENNLLNALFKKVNNILLSRVKNKELVSTLGILNGILNDVDDRYITNEMVKSYRFNRTNERFRDAFKFAEFILLNLNSSNSSGNKDGFAMIFEMNILYEEYIGVVLKEIAPKELRIETQVRGKYLLKSKNTERNAIALRPDIVVYDNDEEKVIIDTKWKTSVYNGVEVFNQGDVYQMYAYITSFSKANRCVLLYPKIEEGFEHSCWDLLEPFEGKNIEIKEVSLENYEMTVEELRHII